jgi:hypothetical protein
VHITPFPCSLVSQAPAKVVYVPKVDEHGELIPPSAVRKPSRDAVKEAETRLRAEIAAIDSKLTKIDGAAKAARQASTGQNDSTAPLRLKLKETKVPTIKYL